MPARRSKRFLVIALLLGALLVLASPLLMVFLPGTALPWDRLANIGDAYGGASALLSALALCGVGASLIYQQRQVRLQMTDFARQNHLELMRLAIESPDLIAVLDAGAPRSGAARGEIYANLTVSYWLAIWELGEIDEQELRGLAGGHRCHVWHRPASPASGPLERS